MATTEVIIPTPKTLNFPSPLDTLSEQDQLVIGNLVEPVQFEPGMVIFDGGEIGDCCYFIDSGFVRIELKDKPHADDDAVLTFLEAGSILGELALLDKLPRSGSAIAHSKVEARRLKLSAIEELEQTNSHIAFNLLAALGRDAALKLRRTSDRLDNLMHETREPRVDLMIGQALVAQQNFLDWPEERVDNLLLDLAKVIADHAGELAEATVVETKIGNVADKTIKNKIASLGVYHTLVGQKGVGLITNHRNTKIIDFASPVGVVFGLVPMTNPVATFIFKTLICLKARNAIILNPSREALKVSNRTGQLISEVLQRHGAPEHLVQWVEARSNRKTTLSFMKHPKIGLILATGGPSMVKAAYSSGNPAIGVGSGNAPVLIALDADLVQAARNIVESKSFDNGLICGSEHNLVCLEPVRRRFIRELESQGAAVLAKEEVGLFSEAMLDLVHRRFKLEAVGHSAAEIARAAKISRPYPIRLIVVPSEEEANPKNLLAHEKLTPILSLFTVPDLEKGLEVCRQILEIEGSGHTAIIHTRDTALSRRFGLLMPASRILVNSPGAHGVIGVTTGLVEVKVICPKSYHAFHGWTGETLNGVLSLPSTFTSLREVFKPQEVIKGQGLLVDLERQVISVKLNDVEEVIEVPYDHLLLANGSYDNLEKVPGLADHGLTVKEAGGVLSIRNHIIALLEQADNITDPILLKQMLTVVIVGGGFTGVEMCASLAEQFQAFKKYYSVLQTHKPRIVLVHSGETLLGRIRPRFNKIADYMTAQLKKYGVELRLKVALAEVMPGCARLSDGEIILADTIISTLGQRPLALPGTAFLPRNPAGLLETDRYLRVANYSNLWTGGDTAVVMNTRGEPCPANALWAIEHGKWAGGNIGRAIQDKPLRPFNYQGLGQAASMGIGKGAGEIYGLQFTGWSGWFLRAIFFLWYMPSKKQSLRVLAELLILPVVGRHLSPMDRLGEATAHPSFNQAISVKDKV